MTEQLSNEEERAKRLMAMGQMAVSLAHEIRNPLGSMELFCTLLKKDLSTQPESFHLADQIHAGIRRVDRIISNCLQFARDVLPRHKPIQDMRKFLEHVLEGVQGKMAGTDVGIIIEVVDDQCVFADPYLISQAVLNLVSNAVEAVVEKQRKIASGENAVAQREYIPEVRIVSQSSDREWILSIIDNGVGISKEEEGQVFDPFFTTKREGTGLGLSIVYRIIDAHGGKVNVSSNPGDGTEVVINIPKMEEN